MASIGAKGPSHSKRTPIVTQRMQQFKQRSHGDVSTQKLHRCEAKGCDKAFTSLPGLKYHMNTSHSETHQQFHCHMCHNSFKSANGLKYHTENKKAKCHEEGGTQKSCFCCPEVEADTTTGQQSGVSDSEGDHINIEEIVSDRNFSCCSELKDKFMGANEGIQKETKEFEKKVPPPLQLLEEDVSIKDSDNMQQLGCGEACKLYKGPRTDSRASRDNVPTEVGAGAADMLKEFAIIATSPQSPLMQTGQPFCWDKHVQAEKSKSMGMEDQKLGEGKLAGYHGNSDYSDRNLTNETVSQQEKGSYYYSDHSEDGSDPRVTSSSPFPASNSIDGDWSHKWPTAVWQCFVKGTIVHFIDGNGDWKSVEELARHKELSQQACRQGKCPSFAPNGLLLKDIQCRQPETTNLLFSAEVKGQSDVLVQCKTDHPFFVKDKGWASLNDTMTAEHYGIPCNQLEIGDLCLPPSHPDAAFGTFQSDTTSPSYTSAVFTLSNMAQQRNQRELEVSPKLTTGQATRKRPIKTESLKAKRPMNGFMLFAKEHRLEYTQMFPGKDNRSISILLGDRWKEMNMADRNAYSEKAKVLAEQQKKMHPDCWKRKK
ncbi:HMG box-containing protein 1-like [Ylistrum balloti]|uniref:HMG box-containing protein 1-like n=1 Tax=Ylistrum balloti TaxID=509963 RepID=UPI002905C316|nr:HMG box-containing protein 1-like [Ylistrum balloti]